MDKPRHTTVLDRLMSDPTQDPDELLDRLTDRRRMADTASRIGAYDQRAGWSDEVVRCEQAASKVMSWKATLERVAVIDRALDHAPTEAMGSHLCEEAAKLLSGIGRHLEAKVFRARAKNGGARLDR